MRKLLKNPALTRTISPSKPYDYMIPSEKFVFLDRALVPVYGEVFPFFSERDPLSELINAMMSHRTKNADTKIAYRQLIETFPSWESVRDGDTAAIEKAIQKVTYPEQKAPRIQAVLHTITAENKGNLSLDFLADWPIEKSRAWLEQMPGVGAKTSAAVLSFSRLHQPALVVDMHHLRVAQRTGVIPAKMGIAKGAYRLQELMPDDWDGQQVYDNHQRFMRHGQKVCFWKTPACAECAIRAHCDYAQQSGDFESKNTHTKP